jgi:hypothetical protein
MPAVDSQGHQPSEKKGVFDRPPKTISRRFAQSYCLLGLPPFTRSYFKAGKNTHVQSLS